MSALRISYARLADHPVEKPLGAVELADELGFHACYGVDETYHKDVWQIFAAAAAPSAEDLATAERHGVIRPITAYIEKWPGAL